MLKLESGHLVLCPSMVSVAEVVGFSVNTIRSEAERKGVELKVDIESSVPQKIFIDKTRLIQILINLLQNAIKFTDQGVIAINVVSKTVGSQEFCEFSVEDSGVGISDADKSKLFKIFSQADDSNTRRYGGIGIGLAICRGIVERMSGTISFDSQEGSGSRFYFRLPI